MAKARPPLKTEQQKQAEMNRLMAGAKDETTTSPIFANQVQIIVGVEEVIIDFYRAGPGRGEHAVKPHVSYVQRIIMPPKSANAFATAFIELINFKTKETPEIPEE